MTVEKKITSGLEQAATGARVPSRNWSATEQRILRSRKRRRTITAMIAVLALGVGGLTFALTTRRALPTVEPVPNPISPQSGGFAVAYPSDWIARVDDDLTVRLTPPGPPRDANEKVAFTISASLVQMSFDHTDMDPFYNVPGNGLGGWSSNRTDVTVASRHAIRIDVEPYDFNTKGTPSPSPENSQLIIYQIEWPASAPQCAESAPCTLRVELAATSVDAMQQYLSAAQQIVEGVSVVPEKALPPVHDVQAKISLKAGALATGGGAVWAFSEPDNDYHLDHLYRIDPRTNAVTGSVDIGYLPAAVAADDDGVWVANRRACDAITDCSDSEHPGSTDLLGKPGESGVMRIDPHTLAVVSTIAVRNPEALAIGAGGVWVVALAKSGEMTLLRIDPATNRIATQVAIAGSFQTSPSVTVRNGAVWVASAGKLQRIDPATNKLVATFDVPGQLITPQPSGDQLWLTGGNGTISELLRFEPASGRLTGTYPLRGYVHAGGDDHIWSAGGYGSYSAFDTKQDAEVGDPTYLGAEPSGYGLTSGFGAVWVALRNGTIWRIAE